MQFKNILLVFFLLLTQCAIFKSNNSKFDLNEARQECTQADEAFPMTIYDTKFIVLRFDDCLGINLFTVGWWEEDNEFYRTVGKLLLLQFVKERNEAFEEAYKYEYLGIDHVNDNTVHIMLFRLIEIKEE
mgnify:CR=1 FL=1